MTKIKSPPTKEWLKTVKPAIKKIVKIVESFADEIADYRYRLSYDRSKAHVSDRTRSDLKRMITCLLLSAKAGKVKFSRGKTISLTFIDDFLNLEHVVSLRRYKGCVYMTVKRSDTARKFDGDLMWDIGVGEGSKEIYSRVFDRPMRDYVSSERSDVVYALYKIETNKLKVSDLELELKALTDEISENSSTIKDIMERS